MFDVNTIDLVPGAEQGAELQLRHPVTGDPIDIWVTVYGPDSRRAEESRAALNRAASTDPNPQADGKVRVAEARAKITMNWRGMGWKGEELPFSYDNAVMVYTERQWIGDQVDSFHGRRANFFKA